MSNEIRVMRTERKYLVSKLQISGLYARLSAAMAGDPVNGNKSYMVRSLYFDTIYNDDYFEKMAGIERRQKIRLRIYDVNAKTAKLEIKEKQGTAQLKRSLIVSRDDAMELQKCNYEVLKKYEEPLAEELYAIMTTKLYRPACMVEYQRIAFTNYTNDTRITLDSDIRANEGNFNVFDPKLQMYPVSDEMKMVLEVKYNGFLLSYIKDVIGTIECHESANSKYCMARKYGLG